MLERLHVEIVNVARLQVEVADRAKCLPFRVYQWHSAVRLNNIARRVPHPAMVARGILNLQWLTLTSRVETVGGIQRDIFSRLDLWIEPIDQEPIRQRWRRIDVEATEAKISPRVKHAEGFAKCVCGNERLQSLEATTQAKSRHWPDAAESPASATEFASANGRLKRTRVP